MAWLKVSDVVHRESEAPRDDRPAVGFARGRTHPCDIRILGAQLPHDAWQIRSVLSIEGQLDLMTSLSQES